jgi:hypothetical protein
VHLSKFFKAFTLASLLFAISIPSISALGQGKRSAFNPDGAFWIVGNPPADFSDFSSINLNGRRLRRLPTQGLQVNNGRTFHYKTLIVKRDNFSFTTETLRGVYYTFAGKFLRGGVFAELDLNDEQPVLEGALTKYKDGKKVAEARLKFSYFGGT